MREFSGTYEKTVLKPFRYPLWVIGFALAVIAAIGYASLSLPGSFANARLFAAAKTIDRTGRHAEAEPLFREVLARSPDARAVRLALAKALFADDDPGNDVEALKLIVDLKLTKSEWEELRLTMPEKYRQLFVEEKP